MEGFNMAQPTLPELIEALKKIDKIVIVKVGGK